MARSTLAGLIAAFAFAGVAAGQQDEVTPPSLKQAGVCSRCHVAQVLEWSASKHTRAGTVCQSCHGPSAAHVANERNQVKPDRLPQGAAAFTALCATCHASGCPKTKNGANCQSCHHQHALSHPDDKQMRPAVREDPAAPEFARLLAEGELQVSQSNWQAAQAAFAAALALRPADRRVARRLRMAERRLHPEQPGFTIVGQEFDPESGLPRRVRVASGPAIEMLLVPGGEVEIGSDSFASARPVHAVRIEPFYLALTETTQQQWLETDPSGNPSVHVGPALPVHNVSWTDAQAWIARLNAKVTGGGFRLPTEAEWEAAAAGTQADEGTAWFRENARIAARGSAGGPFFESKDYAPRAAGLKQPSRAGFYDLLGNVNEWCSSLYRPYPFDARDGRESPAAGDGLRVLRGGAYGDSAGDLHPAFRHSERPTRRNVWNGFRVARTVPR